MKKFIFLAIFLLPFSVNAHYVPGDLVHTGSVDKTFSTKLSYGSRGEEVKMLQTVLKSMLNIYPEGLVTGYYGRATEQAVKRLQKVNGLDIVGSVGPKTRELLNRVLATGSQNFEYLYPQILTITSTSTSPTHMYVFWSTNKQTTSEFLYSTVTPLASTTPNKIIDTNKSLTHSNNIFDLATGTTYYYMIKVTDEFGISATSSERSFTTGI